MFNSVQLVRDLCRVQNIPIAKLEKECGFANGYLNPKKMSKIPYDRAVTIASFLKVPVSLVLTGEQEQKNNAPGELVLTEDEMRILTAFRAMSPDRQKALADLLGLDQK